MMRALRFALSVLALALAFTACAGGSSADGSTSWLSSCEKSSECRRGLSCICGKCTRACDSSRACDALGTGAVCESVRVLGGTCRSGVDTDVCVRGSSGSAAADASPPTGTAPTGTAPTGTAPTGTAPVGTAPTGTAPAILEGGAGDGLVDARPVDAGPSPPATPDGPLPDGGGSCTEDQGCNDFDICNGVETCVAGPAGKTCRGGPNVADGVRCGDDHACMAGACRSLSTCNLSGNWAMKIVTNVTWTSGVIVDGQGEINQWALLKITQRNGETAFTGSVKPCGLTFPDFHSIPDLGDETHGITFDASAFDSPYVTPAAFAGQLTNSGSGTTFETETSTMFLGLDVSPPASATGQWPDSFRELTPENGYTLVDADRDGFPGITASVKTGLIPGTAASYADIIWDIGNPPLANPERASKLRLAIRSTAAERGVPDTCSQLSGTAVVTIHHHVVGCFSDSSTTDCSPDLVDAIRPMYTPTSATFVARHIGSQETCGAVRTAVP